MSAKKRSILIFGIVCTLFAILFLVVAIRDGVLGKQAETWPTTSGTIREAKVVESSGGPNRTFYDVQVQYDYAVSNVAYTSSRAGFGKRSHGTKILAARRTESLLSATNVVVYYNPKDPSMAVLQPGVSKHHGFFYFIGTLFTLIGCTLVIYAARTK